MGYLFREGNFVVSEARLTEEDGSLRVTYDVTGKSLILADTGNGGDTAYQILRERKTAEDNYDELGYGTKEFALAEAMRILEEDYDPEYDERPGPGYRYRDYPGQG